MDYFSYRDGVLYCEDVPVDVIAKECGTPVYIYSRKTLERHFRAFKESFSFKDSLVCFSVKSLSNIAILHLLSKWGSGFDVVSGGELYRVVKAGGDTGKVVFSGVGKTKEEIAYALEKDILIFNVESFGELKLIDHVAGELGKKARVSIRVNPDVDPKTHPYISTGLKKSKFGIDASDALDAYRLCRKLENVEPIGIDSHIGSQITEVSPFKEAVVKLLELIDALEREGFEIRFLDIGGGLGIRYKDEDPPHPSLLASVLKDMLEGFKGRLIVEPGRAIAGNAGIFVTKVLYVKDKSGKRFVIVDGAMNDLIRPSLYGSYHDIVPVFDRGEKTIDVVDVVGPVCESGDFLAQDRPIPRVHPGDLLAVKSAGAYCFTMSSNYNSRPRPPEVLVSGDRFYVIRERESWEDLISKERVVEV